MVQEYYFDNNQQKMTLLISRCNSAKEILGYKELYVQTIDAYNRKHYHLACIGMFSLIDGVLADVSEMATVTSFKKRIQAIENKIDDQVALNEIDRKTLCIYIAMEHIKDSIFGNSSFSEAEPEGINRHWVMHGCTRKKYSKYDFLKLLLWLDAISYMSQLTE